MKRRAALAGLAVMPLFLLAPAASAQTSVPAGGSATPRSVELPPSLLFGIALMMVPLVGAVWVLYRYRRATR